MLSSQIRRLRLACGISQVELARRIGVTKQSISNWENDNIQPSIEMLKRLSETFAVSVDVLLGMDDRKYLEITGLSDTQLAHIQALIDDIRIKENNK